MEPCVGSAPTTCRLQGGCSTNWANTAYGFILTEIFYYHKSYLQLFSILILDTDGYYKQYISGAIE